MISAHNPPTSTPPPPEHTSLDERTSLTTRELYDMCQDSWQRGYDAAHREQDEEHNRSVKGYGRKWSVI